MANNEVGETKKAFCWVCWEITTFCWDGRAWYCLSCTPDA